MSGILNINLTNKSLHEAASLAAQGKILDAMDLISPLYLSEEQKGRIFSILGEVNPSNVLNLEARISVIAHEDDEIQAESQLVAGNELGISDVPLDALRIVFTLLNPKDFFRIRLVSKLFNKIIRDNSPGSLCSIMYDRHFSRDYPTRNPNLGFYNAFREGYTSRCNFLNGVRSQRVLEKNQGSVHSLIVCNRDLYAHSSNEIQVWDLDREIPSRTLPKGSKVSDFAASNEMIFLGSPGKIKILTLDTEAHIRTIKGDQLTGNFVILDKILCIDVNDSSKIEFWDLNTLTYLFALPVSLPEVKDALAVSGGRLYVGGGGSVEIFELATGLCLDSLQLSDRNRVRSLFVLGEKLYLDLNHPDPFCSHLNKSEIWDLVTGTQVSNREGAIFTGATASAIFDGKLCLKDYNDAKILDLDTNTYLNVFKSGLGDAFVSFAVSGGKLYLGCSNGKIDIHDFQATHAQVFEEIADQLSSGNQEVIERAMERFNGMPQAARNKIYGKLYQIKSFPNDYFGCAEHAFKGEHGLNATPSERAEAIRRYLQEEAQSSSKEPLP